MVPAICELSTYLPVSNSISTTTVSSRSTDQAVLEDQTRDCRRARVSDGKGVDNPVAEDHIVLFPVDFPVRLCTFSSC